MIRWNGKLSITYIWWGALILSGGLVGSGTAVSFALMIFGFAVFSALSVNLLGGLYTLSGALVAIWAIKSVLLASIVKVVLLQPMELNLSRPFETIEMFLLSSLAMLFAAATTARFVVSRPLVEGKPDVQFLDRIATLSAIGGFAAFIAFRSFGVDESGDLQGSGFASLARELLLLLPLAVVSATAHTVRMSLGNSCVSRRVVVVATIVFSLGFIGASKEGMLAPFFCFVVTAFLMGYRFRMRDYLLMTLLFALAVWVLIPFSQVGRNFIRSDSLRENIEQTISFVSDYVSSVDGIVALNQENRLRNEGYVSDSYFQTNQLWLERFALIKPADRLVDATLRMGTDGWRNIEQAIAMIPPKFLSPDKPAYNTSNFLARKAGYLAEDDEMTQVAFGFVADAYSAFQMTGVFFLVFVLMAAYFFVNKLLFGDGLTGNIFAIWAFAYLQHPFSETTTTGIILQITRFSSTIWGLSIALRYLQRFLPRGSKAVGLMDPAR